MKSYCIIQCSVNAFSADDIATFMHAKLIHCYFRCPDY